MRSKSIMEKSIERMVDAYVRVGNCRALKDLMMHRQRLAADLKDRIGVDFSLEIRQIEEEVGVIEVGLEKLRAGRVCCMSVPVSRS